MANWCSINNLLDRQISLFNSGEVINADGGVTVVPVLKTSGILSSIQPLSGDEVMLFAKQLQDADTYFICLQLLNCQNGDLIIDDNSIRYRITYFEDFNTVPGRYFAIFGKKIIE